MKKFKEFFNNPRKAIVTSVLAVVVLAAIGGGVVISARAAAESVAIGGDAAVKAAMADAGVDTNSAIVTKTKFEREHGTYVYDVEFIADGVEYDYKVNSRTGAIVESSFEGAEGATPSSDTVMISLDEAKKTALADAGKEAADVTITKEKLDKDDYTHVYDIEFMDEQQKYEYEIDAYSGEILSRETEKRNADSTAGGSGQNEGTNGQNTDQNAGTSEKNTEQNTGTGEQKSGQSENSAAKNTDQSKASDSSKSEQNGSEQTDSASSSFIGIDRAKEIALEHAGLTENDVTFSKAKTDKEHGKTVYEIEFYQGRMEYEYEINASTGEIIEWDKDYDD